MTIVRIDNVHAIRAMVDYPGDSRPCVYC
jgi:hypothetical protein